MTAAGRDAGLQGTRGLAALSVMLYHVGLPGAVGALLVGWGWSGVVLFFVLSGYVLSAKYVRGDYAGPDGRFAAGPYLLRRFWRIWPLYLALLPVYVIVGLAPWEPQLLVMGQYLVPPYSPGGYPLLPQWTLAVEELFYLTLPLWAIAVRGARSYAVLAAAAAVSVAAFYATPLWYQLPTYAVAYVVGVMVARGQVPRLPGRVLAPLLAAGLLLFVNAYTVGGPTYWAAPLVPAIAAGLFGLCLVRWRASWPLTGRAAVRLGDLSYSVYLSGLPVLAVASRLGLPWFGVAAAAVAGTLAVSAGLNLLVERTGIRAGRAVEAWITARRASTRL